MSRKPLSPRPLDQEGGKDVDRRDGHVRTVAFRDPPILEQAEALRQQIAAALLGSAVRLPQALPAFGLTIAGVEAEAGGFALLVGRPDPMVRLHLRRGGSGDAVVLRLPGGRPAAVAVRVEPLHPSAGQIEAEVRALSLRLAAAIPAERLDQAEALADRLSALPLDAPLVHFRQLEPGMNAVHGIVRVGFLCNQDCGMCWQNRRWGRFPPEQVITWIEDLRAAGATVLSISGGEPTLDAELHRYLAAARALGFAHVILQTNAIRFAQPGYGEALVAAGLSEAFVSLHSGDAAVSDAITRAPGTFERTAAGIERLLEVGVTVQLNCVATEASLSSLVDLPELIARRFGASPHLRGLTVSLPTASYDLSLLPQIIPDPRRLRAVLPEMIERAVALGVRLDGLDDPCGPPLCAFGADPRVASLEPVPAHVNFRHHLPACDACAVKDACFGLRPEQIERYGDACAAPLAVRPAPPS